MNFKASSFILVIIWIVLLDAINCIGNSPTETVISGMENATSACDNGWLLVPGYGCFLFDLENRMDWLSAQKYCENQGGHLPEKIDSDLEEVLIEYTVLFSGERQISSWLGASDIGNEGHWMWMHSGCVIETGVYIATGNNVGDMYVENGIEECASQCALTDECVAWTFNVQSSYCWLKSDDSSKGEEEGWTTGTKACGLSTYPHRLSASYC